MICHNVQTDQDVSHTTPVGVLNKKFFKKGGIYLADERKNDKMHHNIICFTYELYVSSLGLRFISAQNFIVLLPFMLKTAACKRPSFSRCVNYTIKTSKESEVSRNRRMKNCVAQVFKVPFTS